jgi:hypothetical protein
MAQQSIIPGVPETTVLSRPIRWIDPDTGQMHMAPPGITIARARELITTQQRQAAQFGGGHLADPQTGVLTGRIAPTLYGVPHDIPGEAPGGIVGLGQAERGEFPVVGPPGESQTGGWAGLKRPFLETLQSIPQMIKMGPHGVIKAILDQSIAGTEKLLRSPDHPMGTGGVEDMPVYGPAIKEVAQRAEYGDISGAAGQMIAELGGGALTRPFRKARDLARASDLVPSIRRLPANLSVRTGWGRTIQGILDRAPGSAPMFHELKSLAQSMADDIVERLIGPEGIDPQLVGGRFLEGVRQNVDQILADSIASRTQEFIVQSRRFPAGAPPKPGTRGRGRGGQGRRAFTSEEVTALLDMQPREWKGLVDADLIPRLREMRKIREKLRGEVLAHGVDRLLKEEPSQVPRVISEMKPEGIEHLRDYRVALPGDLPDAPTGTRLVPEDAFRDAAALIVQRLFIKRSGVSPKLRARAGEDLKLIPEKIQSDLAFIKGAESHKVITSSEGLLKLTALTSKEVASELADLMSELEGIQAVPPARIVAALVISGEILAPIAGAAIAIFSGSLDMNTIYALGGGASIYMGIASLGKIWVRQPSSRPLIRRFMTELKKLGQAPIAGAAVGRGTNMVVSIGNQIQDLIDAEPQTPLLASPTLQRNVFPEGLIEGPPLLYGPRIIPPQEGPPPQYEASRARMRETLGQQGRTAAGPPLAFQRPRIPIG